MSGWAPQTPDEALEARWSRRVDDVARVLGGAKAGILEIAVALGDAAAALGILDEYTAAKVAAQHDAHAGSGT